MKHQTAIALKEAAFPIHSQFYGTCPHVEDEGFNGECGCDIMYKIVTNPNMNELIEQVCPEFESLSFAEGKTKKDNVWVVVGKIGRKKRVIPAPHADEALAQFWLVKHRYKTKHTDHAPTSTEASASTNP